LRAKRHDARWAAQIDPLTSIGYGDVRPLLAGKPNFKADIFIAAKDKLDEVQPITICAGRAAQSLARRGAVLTPCRPVKDALASQGANVGRRGDGCQ
jgi:prephenate dehydrogenase